MLQHLDIESGWNWGERIYGSNLNHRYFLHACWNQSKKLGLGAQASLIEADSGETGLSLLLWRHYPLRLHRAHDHRAFSLVRFGGLHRAEDHQV